jgi:hypothetical protein
LDRRLGGPHSQSGGGEEKTSQPLQGLEPPIIQPVAQRYITEPYLILAVTIGKLKHKLEDVAKAITLHKSK